MENESMTTEFYNERCALDNDIRASLRKHERTLREKRHIDPITPTSKAHAIQLIKDGKFEGADDEKELNKKYTKYDGNPVFDLIFREHKAEQEAYDADADKLATEYSAVILKAKILPPAEGLKVAEAFRTLH
jgi:hypothetical protein